MKVPSFHPNICCVKHRWARMFVLMAAVLLTVMNSLGDMPGMLSIAHSHTDGGWKLVLVGKQRRRTHACTFCGHIWMERWAHMYMLRKQDGVCVYLCLVFTGLWMIFLLVTVWSVWRKWSCSVSFFLFAERSWLSSTSSHALGWHPPLLKAKPCMKPGCSTYFLLHYHMNHCHFATHSLANAGKSLKFTGLYCRNAAVFKTEFWCRGVWALLLTLLFSFLLFLLDMMTLQWSIMFF